MKKIKPPREGLCALTGVRGTYVKSHILPKALTRLSSTGEMRVEAGIGHGIKRRADSWYDPALCIRAGEDILEDIDTKAIEELRRHRLVWSGWSDDQDALVVKEGEMVGNVRLLAIRDPGILQLFFLSLLWRAAASNLEEMAYVKLRPEELEDLRRRVLNKDAGALEDYPVQLFQLITRGDVHNRTPLMEKKPAVSLSGAENGQLDYVRFYFDGLVAHVILGMRQKLPDGYMYACLGGREETVVFCNEFLQSRTHDNIVEMVVTVHSEKYSLKKPLSAVVSAIRVKWPSDNQFDVVGHRLFYRDLGP